MACGHLRKFPILSVAVHLLCVLFVLSSNGLSRELSTRGVYKMVCTLKSEGIKDASHSRNSRVQHYCSQRMGFLSPM